MPEMSAPMKFMVASIKIGRGGKTLAFGAMIRATALVAGWHRKGEQTAGKGFAASGSDRPESIIQSIIQARQEYSGPQRDRAGEDCRHQQYPDSRAQPS